MGEVFISVARAAAAIVPQRYRLGKGGEGEIE